MVESKIGNRLLYLAMVLCASALIIHIARLRREAIEELVIFCGWLATGITIIGARKRLFPEKLPQIALAVTCGLQLFRLRDLFDSPFPMGDFLMVFESARRLYEDHMNPYLDPMANSFPFPAYAIFYYLFGWGGHFGAAAAFKMFWGLNFVMLALSVFCITRVCASQKGRRADIPVGLFWLAILSHPGIAVVFRNGQTSILVLFWIALALLCWQRNVYCPWLPALFFVLAWMQKPYLLLSSMFFLSYVGDWLWKKNELQPLSPEAKIGLAQVVWAAGIALILLVYPGGVSFATFASFFEALHRLQVEYSQNLASNFSLTAKILMKGSFLLGVEYSAWIEFGSLAGCLLVLGVSFYFKKAQQASSPFLSYLPWLVATLIPFSILYLPYYAWAIPAMYALLFQSWADDVNAMFIVLLYSSMGLLHLYTSPGFPVGLICLFLAAHAHLFKRNQRSIASVLKS